MKTRYFFLSLFLGISIAACDVSPEAHFRKRIPGFWQVTQQQKAGETNEMYAEISDSTILYWYERINYIFPYSYRIEGDQLIVWLQEDSLSRPTVIGRLSDLGADGFALDNDEQRLEYRPAAYEDFEQATGKKWRTLE